MEACNTPDARRLSAEAQCAAIRTKFWSEMIIEDHDLAVIILTNWINRRVKSKTEVEWDEVFHVWAILFEQE